MKRQLFFILMLLACCPGLRAQSTDNQASTTYYFIDGVDFQEFGSYIPLEDIVSLTDWRGRSFKEYEHLWDFYGVTAIDVDLPSIECNINDTWQPLPSTMNFAVDKVNLTDTYWKQNPEEGTVSSRYGFLTYKNNGTVVRSDFQVRFHVSVTHKWGILWTTEKLVFDVKATFTDNPSTEASESTGVEAVRNIANDNQYYNMQGRRVAHPTKGLYIVNGRKVLMK